LARNFGLAMPSKRASIFGTETRVRAKVIRRSKTEAQRISDSEQAWTEPYRTVTLCAVRVGEHAP
jgi:hypothetical protein